MDFITENYNPFEVARLFFSFVNYTKDTAVSSLSNIVDRSDINK